MILPDINLLIHGYNMDSPLHSAARSWWEGVLNSTQPVGLPWAVMLGFIRLATNRHVLVQPMTAAVACGHVRSWLEQPFVGITHPGERHAEILFRFLETLGTGGNLTTDAHLAALAVEHQAELHSTDADFARFPGLKWINPLA